MAQQQIHMPSGAGGLMRYGEEYKSPLVLKPSHIIAFVILIVAFVVILKVFFPIST